MITFGLVRSFVVCASLMTCAAIAHARDEAISLPTLKGSSATKIPTGPHASKKILSEIERSFTPHTTVDCLTRPWGGLNVQRSPGANMNTTFLMSSLTVAALPRFEIGTSLMLYGSRDHENNFNAKFNFFRSPVQDWSLGYSRIQYGLSNQGFENPVDMPERMKFMIQSVQLATNIHPSFTRFQLGVALTQVYSVVDGADWLKNQTAKSVNEYGVDLLYPVHNLLDLTIGAGAQRSSGMTAWEDVHFGMGSSLAWYRPRSIFSKPSVGFHYTPGKGDWQALVASKIF